MIALLNSRVSEISGMPGIFFNFRSLLRAAMPSDRAVL